MSPSNDKLRKGREYMRRQLAFFIIFSLMFAIGVHADENPGINDELAPQSFYVDYSAFADTVPNSITLEVYYKIFSSGLSFQKWGQKFKADYSVNVTLSQKGKQVTGKSNDGSLVADDYKTSISKNDFIINKVVFHVSPGNYHLVATLKDPNVAEQLARPRELTLKLKDFAKDTPSLSTIEFLRDKREAESDSEFVKDGMMLVPSVSRMYGDDEPDLMFYYEIYNNDPKFSGDYMVTYDLTNGDKKINSDTSLFPASGGVTSRIEKINVDSMLPGDYELTLSVKSPGNKLKTKLKSEFLIGWSVMALVRNDYKTAVEQLRYIASPDEMKKLANAAPTDRIRLWNEFWKSKDPSSSNADNEIKDEYYRRIRYADLNFGNFGRGGWKTDMGMVYVTYGPPDEIERHPFDIDSKAYQVWYYFGLRRTFRFVDFNGYGDYELIYPYDGDLRKLN
jgi:GWxTD domain-containing protein